MGEFEEAMKCSAIRAGNIEGQNRLIFQNLFNAVRIGQRFHAVGGGFNRAGAARVRLFGQTMSVELLQNLINLGQCCFGRLSDLLGGLLAFGARRPFGAGDSAARAASAITFGAQQHDGAHLIAWLQPAQPLAELPADLRVIISKIHWNPYLNPGRQEKAFNPQKPKKARGISPLKLWGAPERFRSTPPNSHAAHDEIFAVFSLFTATELEPSLA